MEKENLLDFARRNGFSNGIYLLQLGKGISGYQYFTDNQDVKFDKGEILAIENDLSTLFHNTAYAKLCNSLEVCKNSKRVCLAIPSSNDILKPLLVYLSADKESRKKLLHDSKDLRDEGTKSLKQIHPLPNVLNISMLKKEIKGLETQLQVKKDLLKQASSESI